MISFWLCTLALAVPSLMIRAAILRSRCSGRFALTLSYLTGVCQDFFIAFEQVVLVFALRLALPVWMSPYLFWVALIFSTLLQLHVAFDAFLFRKASIRMELSFLKLIDDARFFWDSAKEKKIFRFLPAALCFCALPGLTYWLFWHQMLNDFFTLNAGILGLMLGGIGLLGALLLPNKLAYATNQIAFQHQVAACQKGWRRPFRGQDQGDLDQLIRKEFPPNYEKGGFLSSEYPLLKYTQGFKGDKQLELAVEKGERPHIVFLFLESFRARDVGVLGGQHGVTPCFDALAKKGFLFSDFYANSVRTSRSVLSSLFGIPSDVDASEVAQRSDTPFIGLPQLMHEAGYATGYLHNGPIQFENQDDFFKSQRYQTIIGKEDILATFPEAPANSWGLPDEYLMRYAVDFLEANKDQPQFLTLFTISNHHPWNIATGKEPPPLDQTLSQGYRNYLTTFHYTDACLGFLIDELRRRQLMENTVFFIMGDHGYPMGEHDNYVEQRYLYEENIRIPLLIYAEGRMKNPCRIEAPASQVDLVPTVMDLFNLHGFNLSIGHSLVRKAHERRIFFHNPYVFRNFGCRRGRYKFVYTQLSREVELYDLKDDPDEQHNIAGRERQRVQEDLAAVKEYYRAFRRLYREKRLAPTEALHLDVDETKRSFVEDF